MSKNKGLTLIEVLVVITIIGVLSTLSIVGVRMAQEKAKRTKAESDLSEIRKAIDIMAGDTEVWPGNQPVKQINSVSSNEICGPDIDGNDCSRGISGGESGLVVDGGSFNNWRGPYMNSIPPDPWGHEYFFDTDYRINADDEPCGCSGGTGCIDAAVLGSYGPDGLAVPTGMAGSYGCDDIILILYK